MTGSTMRSSTPPPELISSIARRVALSCDCSMAEVTPVWEKSTPTRHGPPVFSLKLMTLTWTIALVRFERPYVRLQETQIAWLEVLHAGRLGYGSARSRTRHAYRCRSRYHGAAPDMAARATAMHRSFQ